MDGTTWESEASGVNNDDAYEDMLYRHSKGIYNKITIWDEDSFAVEFKPAIKSLRLIKEVKV